MKNNISAFNGDFYDSDGNIKNLLEIGSQSSPSQKDTMSPFNGNFYASDGTIHNIDELLNGSGSSENSSNLLWKPNVSETGDLSWIRSDSTVKPDVVNIKGQDGADGENGIDGTNGQDGINGVDGENGKSAYEIWRELGNEGTEQDFLNSLKPTTSPASLLFLQRLDNGNVVLTHNPTAVNHVIMPNSWFSVPWGGWFEIISFTAAEDVADEEIELIPGMKFDAKMWFISNSDNPNTQVRLRLLDINTDKELATAQTTISFTNLGNQVIAANFANIYKKLGLLTLSEIRMVLEVNTTASSIQFGIVNQGDNERAYILPTPSSITVTGEKGEQGEQGIQGERGEQGTPGSDAHVPESNLISNREPTEEDYLGYSVGSTWLYNVVDEDGVNLAYMFVCTDITDNKAKWIRIVTGAGY